MSEVFCNVYKETDYSKFKYLIGNRSLTETRKKRIIASIKKVGYVLNPIIVNEKMQIIDGQGRHAACKELGLPIYYVIAEGAGTDECVNLNIGQTNWNFTDYVHFYAKMGDENYKKLMDFFEVYPEFTPQQIYAICAGIIINGGKIGTTVKNGLFKFNRVTPEEAESILQTLYENRHSIALLKGSKRVIITGIAWIIRCCHIDNQRLFRQIAKEYSALPPIAEKNVGFFLEQMERIYNKNLRSENCIYFSYEWKLYQKATKAENSNHGLYAKQWREQLLTEGA